MKTAHQSGQDALSSILSNTNIEFKTLPSLTLPDTSSILPSSFAVGSAAQASIGAAALGANEVYFHRTGKRQNVTVPMADAERECTGYFRVNGKAPEAWGKYSGLYRTDDGFVRIHANFDHHRDGVLNLLGFDTADIDKADVEQRLLTWSSEEFEQAAADAGLVVAKIRSFGEWDQHPHAAFSLAKPLIQMTKIGDAKSLDLPVLKANQRPLKNLRVVELTRILAGPVSGRTLAAYGAQVMLVNGPALPNISAIIDTSRGKCSTHIDLKTQPGKTSMDKLLQSAHVFIQGYRPDAIAGLGYSPTALAEKRPGIVYVSLNAYGDEGPWAGRRGFDSLVQSVSGFNHAEALASGNELPQTLPVPILDYASGFLMAFGAQAALLQQQREGGSWHIEVSLLQTANWLRSLGRVEDGFNKPRTKIAEHLVSYDSGWGRLDAMPHAASFSDTPAVWARPSTEPGTHQPNWSEFESL